MIKKNILVFFLFTISIYLNATGIETARVKIIPISIDANSNILFKTKLLFDPQDAGATTLVKYGFLIVNGNNKWEEFYYYSRETIEEEDWETIKILNEQFSTNDFSSIKLYNDIIQNYGFKLMELDYDPEGTQIDLIEEDDTFWNRGYNKNLRVRSLDDNSTYLDETKVTLCFKYENIYLIKNIRNFFNEESTGADFILPNYFWHKKFGVINLGYAKNIDGIVICKRPEK